MLLGLIQNEAVVGDLSHNLRLIVQGYRRCLDAGAELVVASAQALDGAFLHDLAARSSYRLQASAALQALAKETALPLLLASYAGEPGEAATPHPYLLWRGKVRRLQNRRPLRVRGLRIVPDVGAEPQGVTCACDAVLHLPMGRWWQGQAAAWETLARREAEATGANVLLLRGVGCTEGQLSPGGSLALSPQGEGVRLPFFEPGSEVWRTGTALPPAPPTVEQLLRALCCGLRHTLEMGGYEGLAIEKNSPRAALLLALARVAVGARRTVALAPRQCPVCALAGKRLRPGLSAERRLLYISPLTLNDLLLGKRDPLAPTADIFAPLGEVYADELAPLQARLRALLPPHLQNLLPPEEPAQDADAPLLRLMAEENAAPAEILSRTPGADETRLRRLLRLMNAATAHRHTQPPTLRLRPHLVHLPAGHRLRE